jgi:hypothetical protein
VVHESNKPPGERSPNYHSQKSQPSTSSGLPGVPKSPYDHITKISQVPSPLLGAIANVFPHSTPLEVLGSGSEGIVLLVEIQRVGSTQSTAPVAVKILKADSDSRHKRFESEAQSMDLIQHPHAIRKLSALQDTGYGLIEMEYASQNTMGKRLSHEWSPQDIVLVGVAIGSALGELHVEEYVFVDCKPWNIALMKDGIPKLLDFGHVCTVSEFQTARPVMGTTDFVAPELVRPGQPGTHSDVYSLALSLVVIAAGRHISRRLNNESLFFYGPVDISHIPQPRVTFPQPVINSLSRALQMTPTDRTQTGRGFAADLAAAATAAWGPGWAATSSLTLLVDESTGAAL